MTLGESLTHEITTNLIHRDDTTPEHRLLIAIIVRSILDYLDDTAVPYRYNQTAANYTKGSAQKEARLFFFPPERSNPNKPTPFSFHWIAQYLSDDAEGFMLSIRRLLRSAPKRSAIIAKYGRYAPGRIVNPTSLF